jgi:plasmid stabilization system protein ParE
MKIEYTDEAFADLLSIEIRGLQNFGKAAATAYMQKVKHAITLVSHHPNLARLREDADRPVRVYPVGSHLLIYETLPTHIRLVRVLYGRQNWKDHI